MKKNLRVWLVWMFGMIGWSACAAQPALPDTGGSEQRLAPVDRVWIEVESWPDLPVTVWASGAWADGCWHATQVRRQVDGSRINLTLLAAPASPGCSPGAPLPFEIEIPLELDPSGPSWGIFDVSLNGLNVSFELKPSLGLFQQ